MDSLKGAKLLKADGSSVDADTALQGKDLILYYFSAHWCPPCKGFTPKLKTFYEAVDNVEVIFCSGDQSPEAMFSYMKESHGDWLAVELNSALSESLDQKYGVTGIPTLVVVKHDGTLVTKEGRGDVQSKQPKEAVEAWMKA